MVTSITVSAPRPAPSFTPLFVALDRGLWAEEGLEGTIRYRLGVEGLHSGEVDILATGNAHVHFLNGAEIKMVCGHTARSGAHVLMVRSEIASVRDLKNVSVSGEENISELRDLLAHHRVDLDQSGIQTIQIDGGHPKQYEALKRGVGDGAMLGAPW